LDRLRQLLAEALRDRGKLDLTEAVVDATFAKRRRLPQQVNCLMFLVILDDVDMRLEFCGEALRGVMHREDVDLIDTDEPIHDSIGRANDFTYDGVFELRYRAAGFRELDQTIRGRYETGNNDRRVMGRILTDERLNGG
jgi:hypothetical protein